MNKLKSVSFIIWPLVVLIIALAAFWFKPWQNQPKETISVSATGSTQVTPNVAKITATVETTNNNLDTARQENEKTVSQIVTIVKEIGIEEKDIKTQNISAGPGFEREILIFPPPQRPNTNRVSTTLEITIRDFDIAQEVIGALTSGGATNLFGPSLTLDDKTLSEAKSKARENAVEEARTKAEELAKLSKRKLGKVTNISEQGDFGVPLPQTARSETQLKEQASQIQPGQNEVTINLAVEFELK